MVDHEGRERFRWRLDLAVEESRAVVGQRLTELQIFLHQRPGTWDASLSVYQ